MHITTDGIVIREYTVNEFDSVLTLLTKDRGLISAYARGAKKPRGTLRVSAELLSYSCFVLFSSKDRYSVDKADLSRVFMGVRGDIEALSLASYFCQITAELAPKEENAAEYLSLLLNCLYLLDQKKRTCDFIKPIYELRLLTMAGFMPELVACSRCGCFEAEQMLFLPLGAQIICARCAQNHPPREPYIPVVKGVLTAMRHILYADAEKLFAFSLSDEGLAQLGEITQHYLIVQLDKRFDTLDFYLGIKGAV